MFTPEDRTRLRDALVAAARADPRITACALTGSAAAGEAQVGSWLLTKCMTLSLLCWPAETAPTGLARPDSGYELPIQA